VKREAYETVASHDSNRRPRREQISQVVKRHDQQPRHSNVPGANAAREQIADLTPQERQAMAQFVLAMRVTSNKLGYAQRQVAALNSN
jgi:hypothetical protein